MASEFAKWTADQKKALWLNAYNALVMQTVVNHYPIRAERQNYPANSIRQIPGAFEKTAHVIAGKSVTLDQIENTVLARVRRSAGVPRARARRGRQRTAAQRGIQRQGGGHAARRRRRQFAVTPRWTKVDALNGKVSISPIFSWRSTAFIKEYADDSFDLPKREPIELAVIGFLRPHLLDGGRGVHQEEHLPAHLRAIRLAAQ